MLITILRSSGQNRWRRVPIKMKRRSVNSHDPTLLNYAIDTNFPSFWFLETYLVWFPKQIWPNLGGKRLWRNHKKSKSSATAETRVKRRASVLQTEMLDGIWLCNDIIDNEYAAVRAEFVPFQSWQETRYATMCIGACLSAVYCKYWDAVTGTKCMCSTVKLKTALNT